MILGAAALLVTTAGCDESSSSEVEVELASEPDWPQVIASALDEAYGRSGTGMANPEPDAVPEYVHWIPADGHIVYVTSGAFRHRFPHEFSLRVRFSDPPAGQSLMEVAPDWPSRVLAEIARVEARAPRPFAPGNYLRNVPLEGLPYRHFAFVRDPVLVDLEAPGAQQSLVFVQVIPLTDEQLREIDAVETGATNTVLRDWAQRDRLLLVDPVR